VAHAVTPWQIMILALALGAFGGGALAVRPGRGRPTVGAIRWDAWFRDNDYEKFLQPEEWRSRLPFYARVTPDGRAEVRSDSQETMDQEVAYASAAGLDYWAFCYYHPRSWEGADRYNYGWKLYLSSKRKSELNFCLILQASSHLGPTGEWPKTVAQFVRLFKGPTYQRVPGGRPLVYVLRIDEMDQHFGSHAAACEALEELRRQAVAAGLPSPYLVAQTYSPAEGAKFVEEYGFDAVSAYSAPGWDQHKEYPFSVLARVNRGFWDGCKAAGKKVIPIVNAGWDPRPRLGDPHHAGIYGATPWYTEPTPSELAAHVRSALDWVSENPTAAEADTVLVYAWNETDEGGWLVPTLSGGSARLDAIRKVLR